MNKMAKGQREEGDFYQGMTDIPPALEVVSDYVAALASRDSRQMDALRAPDFVLDFVYGDAFESGPLSEKETKAFWPAWFAGFPEMDFEVTRTIAAEAVAVTQWVFTGTNNGALEPPIFENRREATDRTIRFRGISVYDVSDGLIHRETMYIDLATLMVELGVEI
jgi:steroid delta-isomerase-like uncharacterized protein